MREDAKRGSVTLLIQSVSLFPSRLCPSASFIIELFKRMKYFEFDCSGLEGVNLPTVSEASQLHEPFEDVHSTVPFEYENESSTDDMFIGSEKDNVIGVPILTLLALFAGEMAVTYGQGQS